MKFTKSAALIAVGSLVFTLFPLTATKPATAKKRTNSQVSSIPAAGNPGSGTWVTWASGVDGTSRTRMDLPEGEGTALMADWNGNGVATPGRYMDGEWAYTNSSVDSPQWENMGRWGGEPGDIPVTALIDADKRADRGIFRNGTWLWQLTSGGEATDQFGQLGDQPISGDWDGDGKTDLGVYRAGQFQLRFTGVTKKPKVLGKKVTYQGSPELNAGVAFFSLGLPTDIAVAGDWNANGRDTPALVRGRDWFFMGNLKKVKKTSKATFSMPSGSIPLVGQRVGGQDACPTQTRASEERTRGIGKKVRKPLILEGTRGIEGNREVRSTLEDGVAYLVRNDRKSRLDDRWNTTYYDPISTKRTSEESIRRNANAAMSAATLLTTTKLKNFDGLSRKKVQDYAIWHIRSIACQHQSTSLGGWGQTWQSTLWAATAGQAGWMLWDRLSQAERGYVAAMVESEANAAARRGPRYFRDRVGSEISPGNSKADEVSWDLLAPTLALAMMPTHKNAKIWKESAIALSLAAFSRPGDLTKTQSINGINVALRLPGTNANEDGTVTNRGIVNPDYTQNVQHLWWAATLLRAARIPVPEAFFYNADIVYRALSVVEFTSPPYAAPGGTVYQPLGQIYYPMGVSWGVRRPATFVGVDGFANVYSAPDTRADEFLAAHARDTRALQLRWKDGHIYAEGDVEESYKLGKEEYALQQMALAWWAGSWKYGPKMQLDTKAYPNVKLDGGYNF